jgi:DNA polymerase III delta subunit
MKKVQAGDMEVDCRPPKGAGLVKWLAEEFANRGVTAPPQVCARIIERAGEDPGVLTGEAEKLSLYLGGAGQLTSELVSDLVSLAPSADVFALGDALGRRDARAALPILMNLLATEHHLPVLTMMVRHFRILLAVKTRQASRGAGRLGREEAASLGIHPFVLEKSQGQAASWSWPDLTRALAALEEAHRTLVTTATAPRAVLENLALTLTGRNV